MIGNGNVFVTARAGRLRHRANIAGAIAPIGMHLQIAAKPRAPGGCFGQPKAAEAADAACAESIGGFVSAGTVRYAPALSAGALLRLSRALRLPREMRFARPADRRAAKHRKLRLLGAKEAPRFRHYSAEGRCALAIKTGRNAAMEPPWWIHRSCFPSASLSMAGSESRRSPS